MLQTLTLTPRNAPLGEVLQTLIPSQTLTLHPEAVPLGKVLLEEDVAAGEAEQWQRHEPDLVVVRPDHPCVLLRPPPHFPSALLA
jgi:hypothetical protein